MNLGIRFLNLPSIELTGSAMHMKERQKAGGIKSGGDFNIDLLRVYFLQIYLEPYETSEKKRALSPREKVRINVADHWRRNCNRGRWDQRERAREKKQERIRNRERERKREMIRKPRETPTPTLHALKEEKEKNEMYPGDN